MPDMRADADMMVPGGPEQSFGISAFRDRVSPSGAIRQGG
jgi:hypothetical protein